MKKEIDVPDITNPLPDTLRVRVDKPKNIPEVFSKIKNIAGVEEMGYAKDLAKKIHKYADRTV